ncbi:hypothetical protein K438DRAFT_1758810 [Mycena galopus ATCC 62051]|nr:hypothetical protein K438DRAFT_1758810 [Mycena galopus ATCC 62051]
MRNKWGSYTTVSKNSHVDRPPPTSPKTIHDRVNPRPTLSTSFYIQHHGQLDIQQNKLQLGDPPRRLEILDHPDTDGQVPTTENMGCDRQDTAQGTLPVRPPQALDSDQSPHSTAESGSSPAIQAFDTSIRKCPEEIARLIALGEGNCFEMGQKSEELYHLVRRKTGATDLETSEVEMRLPVQLEEGSDGYVEVFKREVFQPRKRKRVEEAGEGYIANCPKPERAQVIVDPGFLSIVVRRLDIGQLESRSTLSNSTPLGAYVAQKQGRPTDIEDRVLCGVFMMTVIQYVVSADDEDFCSNLERDFHYR